MQAHAAGVTDGHRWEFIKENKKVRKQENKNSTKKVIKKKFFLFSWSSSCFLSFFLVFLIAFLAEFLFSFINSHLRSAFSNQISTKWLNSWIILKRKEDYVYLTSNSSVLSPSSYIMRFSILSQLQFIPNYRLIRKPISGHFKIFKWLKSFSSSSKFVWWRWNKHKEFKILTC